MNNRGRPKGTTKTKTVNIDIEEFRKEVLNGQSVQMIAYKFKIDKGTVIRLCKEQNIPCNTADILRFVNKLDKYSRNL